MVPVYNKNIILFVWIKIVIWIKIFEVYFIIEIISLRITQVCYQSKGRNKEMYKNFTVFS